jgi:hypothetical protein
MTTNIDEEVRSLLATAAESVTPQSVPPLRLPDDLFERDPRHPRRLGVRGWLAPATAAAAVFAVVVAAAVVASTPHTPRPSQTRPLAGVPPYYIAMSVKKKPHNTQSLVAGIFATRTGALLATIAPAKTRLLLFGFSAAADDTTFVVEVVDLDQGTTIGLPTQRFDLIRFNPATHVVSTARIRGLTVPRNTVAHSFALSPDGTKLAVTYSLGGRTVFRVISLVTGAVSTWTTRLPGGIVPSLQRDSISWAADNATLAFNWLGSSRRALPKSGLRLLDTAKPSGDLISDSRLALPFRLKGMAILSRYLTVTGGYLSDVALLAPDGRTVIAAVTAKPLGVAGDEWFATFDAENGRLEREFDRGRISAMQARSGGPLCVLWAGAFGRSLVVYGAPGHPRQLGILRSGHLMVLPHDPKIFLPVAAW